MKKTVLFMFALCLVHFSYTSQNLFQFTIQKITPFILARMIYTWHPDSPVPLENLRHITLTHYDFEGHIKQGELVVLNEVVDDLQYIFKKLFKVKFPMQSIKMVDEFDGSDLKSMQANNTSVFYARKVAGTNRWSNHSFGCAIDINPLLNPYSNPKIPVEPKEGEYYLNRTLNLPGMITKNSYIYNLFKKKGWEWGGECFPNGIIDRHHFQKIFSGLNKTRN